ncbi:MAG TPA: phospholipase D-like domain-containing protein [Candidatus Sulfotelmatobacter sp.]|nr:phospholipase D-like domain-containing protein [Candidatus Sulfotelmatobacter sp.]
MTTCFQTTWRITEQLVLWTVGFITWLVQQCANVSTQVLQSVQQWQNQCITSSQQSCSSWGWFSFICNWVTSVVCTLVSVIVQILVLVVTLVCVILSVLAAVLIAVLVLIVIVLAWLVCIFVPCPSQMESATPPDGGWMVTLGGSTPPHVSQGNEVTVLPDGQLACESMVAAIAAATTRIHLLELDFDPAFIATFTGQDDAVNACMPGTTLMAALLAANARGVAVRILLNKNAFSDTTSSVTSFLQRHQPNTIEVAGLHVFPEMMHAKALIVDTATAFTLGLPLDQGYWDTQLHPVFDPCKPSRRGSGAGGDVPVLGNVGNGVGNKPVHTVSLQLVGAGAADVDATFIALWNSVSSDQVAAPTPVAGSGRQTIQIVRTAPPLPAAGLPSGETGVLEAYLRAINNAQRFIYIEEQYFNSPVVGNALVAALRARPALQLIVLLNENPDMPTYKFWQNALLSTLQAVPGAQIGTFSLWRTGAASNGMTEIMQCYLEAKVSVVDDLWGTVGSANLDGASTGHMFEFLPAPAFCFSAAKSWRNVELNAVLYDGIAGAPATGNVAALRQSLWQEHLGSGLDLTTAPAGGWLGLWNSVANANVASLNATQTMGAGPSMILPYAGALEASSQLSAIGIDANLFVVAPAVPT